MRKIQASVVQARLSYVDRLALSGDPPEPQIFSVQPTVFTVAERVAEMEMGLMFYAYAAEASAFTTDEQLICDLKHMISQENHV